MIAHEVARAIVAVKKDPRITWEEAAGTLCADVSSTTALGSSTTEARRRKLYAELEKALYGSGWKRVKGRYCQVG
jgi:hypothetical protein